MLPHGPTLPARRRGSAEREPLGEGRDPGVSACGVSGARGGRRRPRAGRAALPARLTGPEGPIIGVDSGLREEMGYWGAPDPPGNPDTPGSWGRAVRWGRSR